jgi:uncharacterized protein YggT (Ycf19 family)
VKRRSIGGATGALRAAGPSFNCAISSFNQSRHTMRNERVLGILRPTMKFFRATHTQTQTRGVRFAIVIACVMALFAKHTLCAFAVAVDTRAKVSLPKRRQRREARCVCV